MLSIKDLQESGGFVSSKPLKETITWKDRDGNEHSGDIFIIDRPMGMVDMVFAAAPDEKDRSNIAMTISECIRLGADGKERLTYEQAYNLTPEIGWAMVNALNKAFAPKKTKQKMSSGAS